MSEEVAILVQGVSKDFHYSSNRANSVKGILTGIFKDSENNKDIQHALKDISFDVKKGEFFGIVGRNGSGKSTLLKIIAGIYQPNKGHVDVDGKLVPFIELGVGFNPELTGRENVYLNGALLGFGTKEITAMYDSIVEFAELEKFMDQKLKNYSSGMQVRLAFSMAVRAKADILLIDEVLAVGDADFQRKCLEYFKQLKKKKKTVIFVSHDMDSVNEYCDRAILIEDSKIIKEGSVSEITALYKRLFIEGVKDDDAGDPSNDRWGTRDIEFQEVAINRRSISQRDEKLTLKTTLRANTSVKEPIIGFRIKDSTGQSLFGTNTKIKEIKLGILKEGDVVTIEWTVRNVLNDGKYTISVAATDGKGLVNYDWWEDALTLTSRNEHRTPYPIDPPVETRIVRSKK